MEPLLKVEDLTIAFKEDNKQTVVVDKVSFNVNSGEILCIVGESGCGKSVTALSILGLLSPNARVIDGSIIYEGKDLLKMMIRKSIGYGVMKMYHDFSGCNEQLKSCTYHRKSVYRSNPGFHMGYDKKKAKEYAIEYV